MPTAADSMQNVNDTNNDSNSSDFATNLPIIKSSRPKHIPKYLEANYTDLPFHSNNVTSHSITRHVATKHLSPAHKTFTTSLSQIHEPHSYLEVANHSHLKEVMKLELQAMDDNDTWHIVPMPHNAHVIGYRWVYKVKLNANGEIE